MIDFQTLRLTRKPNQYLVAPEGFTPEARPHKISPIADRTAKDLLKHFCDYALTQPNVTLISHREDGLAAELIQRSRIWRFPDTISVEALSQGPDKACLAIYSRARYGYRDFGVNKKRIDAWLKAVVG